MTSEQIFDQTLEQLTPLSNDLKISIARRLLQESGCFAIDFWGRSDIGEIFNTLNEEAEEMGEALYSDFTEQEMAQIASDCDYHHAKYGEFDSDTLSEKIQHVLNSREAVPTFEELIKQAFS